MAGRIILDLPNPSLDGNGDPIPGAILRYYLAGTTTNGLIYATRDLEAPGLPNPLYADDAGRFPEVWAADDSIFDVVWLSPTTGVIATFEDIAPTLDGDNSVVADAQEYADQAAASAAAAANIVMAGGEGFYANTADALSKGVVSATGIVAGSGGTNGTFAIAFSGGAGSGAAGVFTVAGGALTSISITAKGRGYTSAPTMSFAASAGLTGASATAVIANNTDSGEYFTTAGSGEVYANLYQNVSGVAVFVASLSSTEYVALATMQAQAAAARSEDAADLSEDFADQSRLYAIQSQAAAGDGFFNHDLSGARMRYVYSATGPGVEVVPDVFLDPEDGNDAWDGLSGYYQSGTRGPKRTRAGIEATAPMLANLATNAPCCIAIMAGEAAWRDGFDYFTASPRNGNATRTYLSFVVYGGKMRKISCCNIIVKANIVPHGVIANAYEITVPHEMLDASGSNYTSLFFNEVRKLKQVALETDTSAAGTWWAANGGRADPGVSLRIVMHLAANADPRVTTDTIEYTARTAAWASQNNSLVQGIHSFGNGANNGSLFVNNYSEVRLCLAEQGTKHNWLQGAAGRAFDVIAVNCTRSDDVAPHASRNLFVCYAYDGGGTGFINGSSADFTRIAGIIDNSIIPVGDGGVGVGPGAAQFLYCHAAGYIGLLTLTDCWDSGLATGNAGEMYSARLVNYVSYSDFGSNTGVMQMTGLGPLYVEGGFFFGSSTRPFITVTLDIKSLVVVGTYAQMGFFPTSLKIHDSWLFTETPTPNDIKVIANSGTSVEFVNNVIGDSFIPYAFSNPVPTSITADFNYYIRVIGGGGNAFATQGGVSYAADLAAWQALGYDTHSQELSAANTAAINALFVSGSRPTSVNLDPRLVPGTQAAVKITVPFDEEGWQRAKGLPRTRQASLTYLQGSAPAYLVASDSV